MNGTSPDVHLSGSKVPYSHDWMYKVYIEGTLHDLIVSKVRWTALQMHEVQSMYRESLAGFIRASQPVTNPWSKPAFVPRRRTARAAED